MTLKVFFFIFIYELAITSFIQTCETQFKMSKGLEICYSAVDMSQTRNQQIFTISLLHPPKKGGYVLGLSVCLSVCLLDYSVSFEPIFRKFWRGGTWPKVQVIRFWW